jgi:ABC-2 type transport system permease protein
MNVRGGLALIQSTWLSWLQYRSFFFLLAFGWMIPPLVYLFVWSTTAGGKAIGGMNRGEFVAYYLILILVNQLTYSQTNWTVGDLIRDGSMSRYLLAPMSPLFRALSSEIAGKVVYMIFVIPVTAVLAVLLHPELHTTLGSILAFIPAITCAWLLRFFWGYWLALLAFWATRADSLLAVQDALIFLLAGQVAPLVLLPDALQAAATLLPFRYMVGFPVEVLTGQVTGSDLWIGFGFQLGWLLVALALYRTMWVNGVRHYAAVGG